MGRTKGNIIELFIDKAILAIAAIIALIILLVYVVGNPNSVKLNGENVGPGKINETIRQDADELQRKLQEKVQDGNSYTPQSSEYLELIKNSVKLAQTDTHFPLPGSSEITDQEMRTYTVPKLGQIEKPSISVVTMAAYVPTEELTDEISYDKAETKLQDIDVVTVESSINSKQLYEEFHNAFAGKNIPAEQKEEQYGKPVFAVVELQRQMLQKDGTWTEWSIVPRTMLSQKKSLQVPTQADDYGTQIALEQFAKTDIRNEVLQPPIYDNAIPAERWISPSFYNERQKRIDKETEDLKKQQLEAEKARKLQDKATGKRTQPSGGRPMPIPQPKKTGAVTTETGESRFEKAVTEEQLFNEIVLSENTNPATLEKLVFWAHDDTAIPGEKYHYRIRIGVLNPIAGKPWFNEEQKELQNQVVLFSNFSESDPNKPVEIPRHLYFFATDVKGKDNGKTADKIVDVKVARFTMGNWITKNFNVKVGEQIGGVIEAAGTKLEKAGIQTDPIDLSTGNVMVDIRKVSSWAGNGKIMDSDVDELLYSKNGGDIESMPIRERFWPEELVKVYKEISDSEGADAVELLTRTESQSGKTSSNKIERSPSDTPAEPVVKPTPVKPPPGRTPAQRTPGRTQPGRTPPQTRR